MQACPKQKFGSALLFLDNSRNLFPVNCGHSPCNKQALHQNMSQQSDKGPAKVQIILECTHHFRKGKDPHSPVIVTANIRIDVLFVCVLPTYVSMTTMWSSTSCPPGRRCTTTELTMSSPMAYSRIVYFGGRDDGSEGAEDRR